MIFCFSLPSRRWNIFFHCVRPFSASSLMFIGAQMVLELFGLGHLANFQSVNKLQYCFPDWLQPV